MSERAGSGWTMVGRENLAAAKRLLDLGFIRSSLSRSYYSAYAMATGVMMLHGHSIGIGERANPAHSQLPTLLRHNLDRKRFDPSTRRDLSQRMRSLYRFRLVADYGPREYVDRTHAIGCLRDASIIADRLTEGI